jgi:hypothetical protein
MPAEPISIIVMSTVTERTARRDPLVEYTVPEGQHVGVGVVRAAEAAGLHPADRPRTLADHVDPDALEDLIGADRDASTVVEFTLWEHPVRIAGSTVRIESERRGPSP